MTHRIVLTVVLCAVFVLVGGGIFGLLASLRPEPEQKAAEAPRAVVRAEPAVRAAYRETLSGYGQATALNRATVAAEVPGVIEWISPKLEAGAEVVGPELEDGVIPGDAAPGEILVRLDDADLTRALEDARARLAQTEASVTRAEAVLRNVRRRLEIAREDLETSQEELKRVERLYETRTATASELDRQRLETRLRERGVVELEGQETNAQVDLVAVRADRTAAVAREGRASQDLARTVIRAPYHGRIEDRLVDVKSRVAPGTPLFRIVDPARVQVAIALGGSHFGEFRPGSAASIRLREGGPNVWTGEVARVSPSVDPADRTCRAYLVIEGAGGAAAPVPPGEFVVADIEGENHENVFVVPRTAFLGDRLYVAVPAEDDGASAGDAIVEERVPEVRRWLTDVALVGEGLRSGELVVLTNLESLANGSRVRIATGSGAVDGAAPR